MRPWFLLACALMLPGSALADPLDRGRAIYQGGDAAGLSVRLGQRLVPARGISCAGCHGADAAGGAELQAGPAIDWASLSGRGYDAAALTGLLTEGRRPDGSLLGLSMPRFALARDGDAEALAAYLAAVAAIQRTGLTADRLLLRREAGPGLDPFWQAFGTTVAEAAPNGIFGRRIALTTDQPAFAALADRQSDPAGDLPALFPLFPLIGDEDPGGVRGASAALAAQIAAAAGSAPLQVLADPATASRLRRVVDGSSGISFPAAPGEVRPDQPVFVIGPDLLAQLLRHPPAAPIHAPIDDLARLSPPPPGCVIASDPRPADRPGPVLARYGRIAALLLVEALKRCGPDCTRARLMRGFDDLRLGDPGWPALDYRSHRLTGTTATALRPICDGRAGPVGQGAD